MTLNSSWALKIMTGDSTVTSKPIIRNMAWTLEPTNLFYSSHLDSDSKAYSMTQFISDFEAYDSDLVLGVDVHDP